MNCHELSWIVMNSHESSWIIMNPNLNTQVHENKYTIIPLYKYTSAERANWCGNNVQGRVELFGNTIPKLPYFCTSETAPPPSWLSHYFLMTFLLLTHDILMTFSWLSHVFFITVSWLSYDYHRFFSGLPHIFLMTFLWLSQDFLMTFS